MSNVIDDPAAEGRGSINATSLLDAWDEQPAVTPAEKPKRVRIRSTKTVEKSLDGSVVAATDAAIDAQPSGDLQAVETSVSPEPPKRARKRTAAAAPVEPAAEPKAMADLVDQKAAARAFEAPLAPPPVTDPVEQKIAAKAPEPTAVSPFERLGLSPALLRSILAVGYEEPTPIQEMTIPVLLAGKDIIAQAQTGSGKTAAFGLPIIESIDPRDRHIQALVLCPTRELAIQVAEALHKYGRHKEVETLPIYGGQPYERQFRGLQRGPHIVVGTPGRVMDHMRRETLNLDHTKFFVLDEADEMLDMGFVEDIEWILQQVPESRQTALFSATMPPRIAQLAAAHLRNPERLTVAGKQMTVPETHQSFYEVPRMRKVDALTRILDAETPPLAMIFCRTKMGVDELGEALQARGYQTETLHGDLSQAQRDRVMRRFRTGQADILIATDVAARGLDIPNVTHVINYDIPESAEAYVHRIGRTGRAGKKGEAITLVTPRETRWLHQIEKTIRAKIEIRRLPTMADVAERRLELLKQQILDVMKDDSAYSYYTAIVDDLAEVHDASQIAAVLLKLYADETGRGAPAEPKTDDIALVMQPAPRPEQRFERPGERLERGPRDDSGMVRLFINIGRNFGVRPQDFVGAIANEAGIPGRAVGAIDIFEAYSFVDVPANVAERVIDALVRSGVKGRPVNAEISRPDAGPRVERGPRREFDRGPAGPDRGPRRDGGGFGGRGDREPRREWSDRDREGGYRQPGPPSFERPSGPPSFERPAGPPSFERRPEGDRFGGPRGFGERRDDVPRRYESDTRGRGPRRDH